MFISEQSQDNRMLQQPDVCKVLKNTHKTVNTQVISLARNEAWSWQRQPQPLMKGCSRNWLMKHIHTFIRFTEIYAKLQTATTGGLVAEPKALMMSVKPLHVHWAADISVPAYSVLFMSTLRMNPFNTSKMESPLFTKYIFVSEGDVFFFASSSLMKILSLSMMLICTVLTRPSSGDPVFII